MNRITLHLACLILPFLLLPLLLACQRGRATYMRQQLAHLQALNQADSLLTDDSLAQALALYFDDHGTPNEQMEAHYLLGRTYADRGEAPAAIAAYHDAIDRADTTAADCDYRQLSKVYGQMGELFYWQNLLQNALWAYDMSCQSALRNRDTLLSIVCFEQKAKCYYDMGKNDSAQIVTQEACRMYLEYGDTLSANTASESLIFFAIEDKDFSKAERYIDIYGHSSRTAEDTLHHQESWGLFKIHKGLYYQGIHRLDSAAKCFHEGLSLAANPYNRLMAYQGLFEAYKELGIADSIAKYAELSLEANDSTITTHTADQLQRIQALYNYDRYRLKADRLSLETVKAKQKTTFLTLVLIAIISIAVIAFVAVAIRRYRKSAKRLKLQVRYTADTLLFKTFNDELRTGNGQSGQEKAIEEKIQFLKESLSKQARSVEAGAFADSFQESDIVASIREYGQNGKPLPEACWTSLRQAINVYAPTFMESLAKLNTGLDLSDTQVCQLALIRNMSQKSKAAALGAEYHTVAMRRKRLFEALFGRKGSAKDFDEALQKIAFGD